jgi:ubiquinone/menaquinone biosynthesis C-methylase UbiE
MSQPADIIDVQQLLRGTSIEEFNRLAEEYFARENDWTYYLAKPFGSIDEAPQLLINLAVTLQGMALFRGASVLEFGAGTCWASRYLTQLGCRVTAVDVSPTALAIGQELYRRQPVSGEQPEPRFLLWDGTKLDLPDQCVDRVMCLDALHHVPNPREVIFELGRVLKDGGIAGFAEPGPNHSQSPQSQYEMRTFKVIENDIDIPAIWRHAQEAGFTDLKLAIFNVPPVHLSLHEFEDFLKGGPSTVDYARAVSDYMQNQRTFFLYKGTPELPDSRFRDALHALINVSPALVEANADEPFKIHATVTNDSKSVWLPRNAGPGAVLLGCHVYDKNGDLYHHSFHWEALTPDERKIFPGETVNVEVNVPPLPKGEYVLEFDMVSNDVSWFSRVGSPVVRVVVNVK